jgi:hypothetical protein
VLKQELLSLHNINYQCSNNAHPNVVCQTELEFQIGESTKRVATVQSKNDNGVALKTQGRKFEHPHPEAAAWSKTNGK